MTSTFNLAISALTQAPFAAYPELTDFLRVLPQTRDDIAKRLRLLADIAPTLQRVNPRNPKRSVIERLRTQRRRKILAQLHVIESRIIATIQTIIVDRMPLAEIPHPLGPLTSTKVREAVTRMQASRTYVRQPRALSTRRNPQ